MASTPSPENAPHDSSLEPHGLQSSVPEPPSYPGYTTDVSNQHFPCSSVAPHRKHRVRQFGVHRTRFELRLQCSEPLAGSDRIQGSYHIARSFSTSSILAFSCVCVRACVCVCV